MFQKERRTKIEELLRAEGRVETDDLARRFDISVDSIRKDLQHLARHGRCKRVYGGAVAIDSDNDASPAIPTATAGSRGGVSVCGNDEGRMAVARRALEEIKPGDAVFLDISRTNLFLADLLVESGQTCIVTTNSLGVLQRLAGHPNIAAMSTGGVLNIDMSGFTGSATVSLFEPLLFSKAFIGAGAIDLIDDSVMTLSMGEGSVKREALSKASTSYLMAEASKFQMRLDHRFASVRDFDAVITDLRDEAILGEVEARGVKVLQA